MSIFEFSRAALGGLVLMLTPSLVLASFVPVSEPGTVSLLGLAAVAVAVVARIGRGK